MLVQRPRKAAEVEIIWDLGRYVGMKAVEGRRPSRSSPDFCGRGRGRGRARVTRIGALDAGVSDKSVRAVDLSPTPLRPTFVTSTGSQALGQYLRLSTSRALLNA